MPGTFRDSALEYHRLPRPGKLEVVATKTLANQRDLALARRSSPTRPPPANTPAAATSSA